MSEMSESSLTELTTRVQPISPVNPDLGHAPLTTADSSFEKRYAIGALLGSGGMGEVRLCRDRRIGREVAYKTIKHDPVEGITERFLREARIQGQLEHPAIVPVYDLGVAPDGSLFFTMKRVPGLSLTGVMNALRDGDPEITQRFTLRRLLVAFIQVCMAIDYAHQHGVVHRDLKPPNIMLGLFGEVYILDWGLAKLVTGVASPKVDPSTLQTARGAVMGTPGYMAPEQIKASSEVDARTDVFALGAVLFELLTLEPLFNAEDSDPVVLYKATLGYFDARPSVRAPHRRIPPELDSICVQATARDPSQRFPSARELSNAVERFLDGDRDHETRRRLAAEHAEAAWRHVRSGHLDEGGRAETLAEVGRALALDPGNPSAMQAFASLLAYPMKELPKSVESDVASATGDRLKYARRAGALAYAAWLAFLPMLMWMGIRDYPPFIGMLSFTALTALIMLAVRPGMFHAFFFYVTVFTSTVAITLAARMLGAFVIVPSLLAANLLGLCLVRPRRGAPWPILVSVASVAILIPILLELLGLIGPSYLFQDVGMTIVPQMLDLPRAPTLVVLLLASLALIAMPVAVLSRVLTTLDRAELELRLQSWHFQRLISSSRTSQDYPPSSAQTPAAQG